MKHLPNVLIALTILFAGILMGMFFARNRSADVIEVRVSRQMMTAPTETIPAQTAKDNPDITFPINLNRATRDELTALPGIGDVLARRIVSYRNANGRFTAVEQLLNVEGIAQKTVEGLWDLVTLD